MAYRYRFTVDVTTEREVPDWLALETEISDALQLDKFRSLRDAGEADALVTAESVEEVP